MLTISTFIVSLISVVGVFILLYEILQRRPSVKVLFPGELKRVRYKIKEDVTFNIHVRNCGKFFGVIKPAASNVKIWGYFPPSFQLKEASKGDLKWNIFKEAPADGIFKHMKYSYWGGEELQISMFYGEVEVVSVSCTMPDKSGS